MPKREHIPSHLVPGETGLIRMVDAQMLDVGRTLVSLSTALDRLDRLWPEGRNKDDLATEQEQTLHAGIQTIANSIRSIDVIYLDCQKRMRELRNISAKARSDISGVEARYAQLTGSYDAIYERVKAFTIRLTESEESGPAPH